MAGVILMSKIIKRLKICEGKYIFEYISFFFYYFLFFRGGGFETLRNFNLIAPSNKISLVYLPTREGGRGGGNYVFIL